MSEIPKLVSVESPFNSIYPWHIVRNVQYAILANTHAASLGDVTWTPHICNTQYVKCGLNGYISDTLGGFYQSTIGDKYSIGRSETLRVTNLIRQHKIDKVVCYIDFGISSGMESAIDAATVSNVPIEYRKLPQDLKKEVFGESIMSTIIPIIKICSIYGLALYGLKYLFH